MIPVQCLVSDYGLRKEGNELVMRRWRRSQELKSYLKEHPALRNPLFFLYNYITYH